MNIRRIFIFLALFLSIASLKAQVIDSTIAPIIRDTVFLQEKDTIYLTVRDTVSIKTKDTTILFEQIILETKVKRRKQQSKVFGRWVYSPVFTPGMSLYAEQNDSNGESINIGENNRFLYGFRAEKYFPNRNRGLGFEMDFMSRSVVYNRTDNRFTLYENNVGFSPFFNLKKGKFNSTFHPAIEIGLRNEFIVSSKFKYFENDISGKENDPSFANFYRLWGYVGAGWKRDLFNQSGSLFKVNRTKAGLSSLQVKFYFSVFNQANTFRDSAVNFPSAFTTFKKNKAFETFLTLSYTHNFDWRHNLLSEYDEPNGLFQNKLDFFVPPIVNTNSSRRGLRGNLFLEHEFVSPAIDSVFIVTQQDTSLFNIGRNVANAGAFTVGYTMHLLGNHKKFVNETTGKDVKRQDSFSYDVFVKAGYSFRSYRLSNLRVAHLSTHVLEGTGGIKMGFRPPGLYLILGYTYAYPLKKEFLTENRTVTDFNFSNQTVHIPFAGFGIRNNFYVLFRYYYGMDNLKEEKGLFDNIGITVGFGG